eukprot:3396168-Amphidinium_carterae.3
MVAASRLAGKPGHSGEVELVTSVLALMLCPTVTGLTHSRHSMVWHDLASCRLPSTLPTWAARYLCEVSSGVSSHNFAVLRDRAL